MKLKNYFNFSGNRKSFTLIELLVVIAVIGLLASIIIVNLTGARTKANVARGLQFSQSVHNALGSEAVGVWSFDEGSGTIANDSSGYNNHGTLANGPVWRCAGTDPSYTPSSQGCSIQFDGVDDYVGFSQILPIFDKSFTISMWIKIFSGVSNRWGVLLGDYGLGGINVNFELHTDGRNRFYWNANPDLFGTKTLQPDTWYLITFARDKDMNTVKSYVNTEVDIDYSGAISDKTAIVNHRVGIDSRTGDTAFGPGLIDEVRIYEKALETAQVEELYYAGLDNLLAKGLIDEEEYQERLVLK
jgi:prepilin-type N-terminal cleavage/methylation domain-containing protein